MKSYFTVFSRSLYFYPSVPKRRWVLGGLSQVGRLASTEHRAIPDR